MNVVGKVGSLITQGVYSVATPFHPFGGAVDIIVVEQQDGTYRSTPWYVRFGKFQGFLKGAEKIVRIYVNGVEANFHMFLDNSGEAYFLREVVPSSEDTESNDRVSNDFRSFRTSQCDVLDNIDDDHHNIYDGSQEEGNDGGKSNETVDEHSSLGSPSGYRTDHHENFEAENVVRSSEESNFEMVLMSVDGRIITAPISREEENTYVGHLNIPQFHLGPVEGSCEDFDANIDVCNGDLYCDQHSSAEMNTETSRCQNAGMEDAKGVSICESETNIIGYNIEIERSVDDTSKGMSKDHDLFKSCLDLTANIGDAGSDDAHPLVIESEKKEESNCSQGTTACRDIILEETEANVNHDSNSDLPLIAGEQVVIKEMKRSGNNINNNLGLKDVEPSDHMCLSNSELDYSSRSLSRNSASKDSDKEAFDRENAIHEGSEVIPIHSICNEMEQNDAQVGSNQEPGISAIELECGKPDIFSGQRILGFGFEVSLCGHLLRTGMGRSLAKEAFEAHRITEDEFKASGSEIIKNGNLVLRYKEEYFMWDKVAHIIVGMALFGFNFSVEPTDSIPIEYVEKSNHREEAHGISPSTSSNRWRLWPIPFRPVKFLKNTNSNCSIDDLFFDSVSCLGSPCEEQKQGSSNNLSPLKQLMRTNMPTSEQIASMNLKDGQNAITFSFTTKVLGKQQVDAHVYLWKWNTKIVISDVDGTITRSDVLGQVMPLVGRDWAQSGVARLFSAIKENGYQLLFLSARAIVQAYLTKSFLFNLKQDGNALPTGPVVISPDGLFPSLYREVIRRAPHEFKIACLQDIRALFPSDYNPFYAGFGNRDTDELSYKKIGIPEGKIFIINPKGEVALHNCNGMKTYTSLHTLVDDMFPPTSLAEQEDYNSWNYWKVPLPSTD